MGWASAEGGKQHSWGSQESRPTTPQELEAYFNNLSNLSGGQMADWAMNGTPQSHYNALTQQKLQSIGGAGETRLATVDDMLADQKQNIQQNKSLTYDQGQQATQQATGSADKQKEAINKEVQAAMTGLASQEAMRQYQSNLANAGLTAQDLALLSQIYFGGKGQYSKSQNQSSGWNHAAAGGSVGTKGG